MHRLSAARAEEIGMMFLAGDHPCRGIIQRIFREENKVIGVLTKQVCLNNVLNRGHLNSPLFWFGHLIFGEFDVLFQYPFVYDPTNFREESKEKSLFQ